MPTPLSVLTAAPEGDDEEMDLDDEERDFGDDDAKSEIGNRIARALGVRDPVDSAMLVEAIEDLLELRG